MAETKDPIARDPRQQAWADLTSVIGGFVGGSQAERQQEGQATQNWDQLMLEAQRERDQTEGNSLARLASTGYLRSGGRPYTAPQVTIGGQTRQLPSFGFGPRAATNEQMQGATALENQLLRRLEPGGTFTPTDLEEYGQPGTVESIAKYAGLGTGVAGTLESILGLKIPGLGGNGGGGAVNALGLTGAQNAAGIDSVAGMGVGAGAGAGAGGRIAGLLQQVGPYAGIATGALGLMKDRGWAGNMASGASTGAGIGSMVMPGIGTAVGAGIGALGGLLRGIGGGPSKEELEGRQAAGTIRQSIGGLATPQQIQEAGGDQAALVHIMVRDAAIRKGANPAAAEAQAANAVRSLWESEKSGGRAVGNTASSIQSLLRG